jgi:hypothetical protein
MQSVNGGSGTIDIDFAAQPATVELSLTMAVGSGLNSVGVKSFRRIAPAGVNPTVDFGGWPAWPAFVQHDAMNRVTPSALTAASGQITRGLTRIDFWG